MEVITRENHELAQTLQKRKIELELLMEKDVRHEHEIKQRDDIIKILSQKEEEQANIIKLLRNNFENRSKIDSDVKYFFRCLILIFMTFIRSIKLNKYCICYS